MRNVRRYVMPGHPVFITQVCRDRARLLEPAERKLLVLDVLRELKRERGFRMLAWALLDDHFHLLIEPRDGRFSELMLALKLRVRRRLPEVVDGLWQMRFHDHICRSEDDVERHIDYIHYNPVKHGLVARPFDWVWSSLRTYVQLGMRSEDWAAAARPSEIEGIGSE